MAVHGDDAHLHSLQVSVLLIATSEAVLLAVPAIFIANDVIQNLLIRPGLGQLPLLTIAVAVVFPPLAVASIMCVVLLQKGLRLRRPAFLLPYLIVKSIRLLIDIIVLSLATLFDRSAYHLLAYALSELLLSLCSIDIVWRTKQFLSVLERRCIRLQSTTERHSFRKRRALSTIEEVTSSL